MTVYHLGLRAVRGLGSCGSRFTHDCLCTHMTHTWNTRSSAEGTLLFSKSYWIAGLQLERCTSFSVENKREREREREREKTCIQHLLFHPPRQYFLLRVNADHSQTASCINITSSSHVTHDIMFLQTSSRMCACTGMLVSKDNGTWLTTIVVEQSIIQLEAGPSICTCMVVWARLYMYKLQYCYIHHVVRQRRGHECSHKLKTSLFPRTTEHN